MLPLLECMTDFLEGYCLPIRLSPEKPQEMMAEWPKRQHLSDQHALHGRFLKFW